jgi:hypothetical protein
MSRASLQHLELDLIGQPPTLSRRRLSPTHKATEHHFITVDWVPGVESLLSGHTLGAQWGVRRLDPDQEAGDLIQKKGRRLVMRKRASRALSAPPVSTGTRHRHMRSLRRRPGGRLPWRHREAPRCFQRAVAISTIALLVLVVLLPRNKPCYKVIRIMT